jgi:hypothetical protein
MRGRRREEALKLFFGAIVNQSLKTGKDQSLVTSAATTGYFDLYD